MNKLLTKVARLALGLSLAAGVGVAIGSKAAERADAADSNYVATTLSAGKKVLIVSHDSSNNYYIIDAVTAATSAGPQYIKNGNSTFTISNGTITGDLDSHLFTVSASSTNWKFATGSKYLKWSGTSSNTAARINTGDSNNTWTAGSTSGGTLKFSSATRYLGVYTAGSDWRTYNSSTASNYSGTGGNIQFFEKTATPQTITASADSAYTDETITLTSNATTATWSITANTAGASLSTTSAKSTVVSATQAGSVTVQAVASGYTTVTKTVTFSVRPAGTFYDVTFDSDGGSNSPASQNLLENSTFEFPSPGTKAHYTFLGWSSNGGTTKYAAGTTSPAVTGDTDYIAYWQEDAKVAVTYSAGDGTGTSITTNEYVGSYTIGSFPGTFTAPSGKQFLNWSSGGNNYNAGASYTLVANTPVTFTAAYENLPDVLTATWTGVASTAYTAWSGKNGSVSCAVYAGNSAKHSSGALQLKSKDSVSGIVTTTSGGTALKVSVVWNSNTSNGNKLDVYGKSSAYSAASDLYNASTQGTKIGDITYGTSTELVINDTYKFIGLRSNNGAVYFDSINIYWEAPSSTPSAELETDEVTLYTNNSDGVTAHVDVANCNDALFEWTTSSAKIILEDDDTDTVTIKPAANATAGDATVTLSVIGTDLDEELTLTVHVVEPEPGETIQNPFSVADARDHIDDVIQGGEASGNDGKTYYVTGIVSSIVSAYSSQYQNVSFNFSDDGLTTSYQFEAFHCGGTDADLVEVGDVVIVSGTITLYNSTTYEFTTGCVLESRVSQWAFDHIELTTEEGYDNHYYKDSTFTSDGLVVLLWEHNSTNGTDRSTDVTASSTFNADLTSTGTKQLTATYNGHNSSNTLTYHVVEKPEYDIAFGSATGSTKINGTSITANGWTITTTFSGDASYTQSSAYSQVGANGKPATSIVFTKTLNSVVTIKNLIIDVGGFSGTEGTVTLEVGNTTIGEGSLNGTSDVTVSNSLYGRGSGSTTVLTITISNSSTKGIKVYGIAYEAKTDAEMVSEFITEYMHMSHTTNDGSCTSEGWYSEAKTAYGKLHDDQKSLFNSDSTYADAKARLVAWATANGETFDPAAYTFTSNNGSRLLSTIVGVENTNTIAIIVIISLVSVTAIGGYFFIKRREEN